MLPENAAVVSANYAAQAILILGFGLMMRYYYRSYKRAYLRFWAYAGFYYGLSASLAALLASQPGLHDPVETTLAVLRLSFVYLSLGLLLIGAFDITREELPERFWRWVIYIGTVSLGSIALLPLLGQTMLTSLVPFLRDTVMFLVSGAVLITIAVLIIGNSAPTMGPRLIAAAFSLLGIKNIGMVQLSLFNEGMVLSDTIWLLQGLFNVLFIAMAALGVIIWLLESERHRSLLALQKAEYLNTHDALTGVENRAQLMSKMPVLIDASRATGRHLIVFMVGINRFKAVNDTLGIRGGDRALIEVSQRFQNLPIKPLALARLSGDVFVLIFDHLKRRSLIEKLGQVISQVIEAPMQIDGKTVNLTSSIGVARYPQNGVHGEALLSKANIALANAKRPDNPACMFYQRGMDENYIRLIDLEPELKAALNNDELVIYLQPLYQTATKALCGFEALVRWQHPQRGLLPPNEFLPFIEELGMAAELDNWVLNHCAEFISAWKNQGLDVLPVAINISARHFQQPELVGKLRELLSNYQLESSSIQLEITENVAMTDVQAGLNVLEQLQTMGIKVSIDDFGTGYSSLAYLRRLPVRRIKIDRSFITELLQHPQEQTDNLSIVEALIQLSHTLNKKVVAEGVENADQLELLRVMKCDQVQGYHLCPPVRLDVARNMLESAEISGSAS